MCDFAMPFFAVTAVCSQGCYNGGLCIRPGVCSCRTGWTGYSCRTRKCIYSTCTHVCLFVSHNVY